MAIVSVNVDSDGSETAVELELQRFVKFEILLLFRRKGFGAVGYSHEIQN